MRAIVKTSVVALTAALALGSVVYGQSAAPQQRPVEGSAPAPAMSARLPVEIGDKLRISFYETIDMAAAKQNGPETQGALRTFYQRMDLSGEYAVEQDGAISIPLLGRFQVEGKSLDEIRADLGVSFSTVIGRSANTDIKISERSPIYVVGPVKNPGAYKYVPGMIVLHAMALAGGLDRGEGNLSGMIDGAREMERLRTMTLQVKQLLARRTRLEAERDGASTLPVPIQLVRLAGEGTARSFIATESTILRAEQVKRQQQDREIALKIGTARNEVEALKRKLEQVDVQKDLRLERLNDMQKLKDRGLVTSSNILTLRTELADLEAHRQDYLVGILQAEARLADAEEASPRQLSEESASLAKEIATVDKDIAAAQEAMISAKVLATILYRPSSGGEAYEIVRQSKDGAKMLQATETSPLMPGDVLKITPKAGAVSPSFATPIVPPTDPALTHIRTANQD